MRVCVCVFTDNGVRSARVSTPWRLWASVWGVRHSEIMLFCVCAFLAICQLHPKNVRICDSWACFMFSARRLNENLDDRWNRRAFWINSSWNASFKRGCWHVTSCCDMKTQVAHFRNRCPIERCHLNCRQSINLDCAHVSKTRTKNSFNLLISVCSPVRGWDYWLYRGSI